MARSVRAEEEGGGDLGSGLVGLHAAREGLCYYPKVPPRPQVSKHQNTETKKKCFI